MALCNDFADEGLEFGWGLRDLKGFAEHGLGLVKEFRVFTEEGDKGLIGFDLVTEFGVHLDAGLGGDRVAGFGAACPEPLDGPAYLFAVHGGEVAGGWGIGGPVHDNRSTRWERAGLGVGRSVWV